MNLKLERWSSFYEVQQSGLKARPECLVYKKPWTVLEF